MATIIIEDHKDGKDANFIRTLIKSIFSEKKIEYQIESSGGFHNLPQLINLFKQNDDEGNKNIIIFDTDTKRNYVGYSNRKKYIEDVLTGMKVHYKLFLLPNNNNEGTFETLYEKIIKCFESYESCLSINKVDGQNLYNVPDQKTKIYAYISSQKMSNKKYEAFKNKHNWQFENPEYWDIENSYLDPLKEFLKANLEE